MLESLLSVDDSNTLTDDIWISSIDQICSFLSSLLEKDKNSSLFAKGNDSCHKFRMWLCNGDIFYGTTFSDVANKQAIVHNIYHMKIQTRADI